MSSGGMILIYYFNRLCKRKCRYYRMLYCIASINLYYKLNNKSISDLLSGQNFTMHDCLNKHFGTCHGASETIQTLISRYKN